MYCIPFISKYKQRKLFFPCLVVRKHRDPGINLHLRLTRSCEENKQFVSEVTELHWCCSPRASSCLFTHTLFCISRFTLILPQVKLFYKKHSRKKKQNMKRQSRTNHERSCFNLQRRPSGSIAWIINFMTSFGLQKYGRELETREWKASIWRIKSNHWE